MTNEFLFSALGASVVCLIFLFVGIAVGWAIRDFRALGERGK